MTDTIHSDLDYLIDKYRRLNSARETYRRTGIIQGLKLAKAVFLRFQEEQAEREAR